MRAIDTNVLVRLIARDDARQVNRAETFVADGAWVPTLVLAETVWVLQSVYALDNQQIATTVGMLLEHDRLVLQDSDAVRAALSMFESQRSAGFTDCLVIAAAGKEGHIPVGTFDRSMSHLDGAQKP